jgi:histidinol-phosphatase (PHP family)
VIVDYHMHLRAPDESIDHSVEAVERFVEVAAARGIDEIGFTEHVYYFQETRSLWSLPYQLERCKYPLEDYVDAVVEAKNRNLPVKLGLEVDFEPSLVDQTREILAPSPWDYLIGSIHFIDGLGIDADPSLVETVGPDEAWTRYYDTLGAAAESELFEVLGHPDLVKFFGPQLDWDWSGFAGALDGVCLEISTAGFYKPHGRIYPDPRLLTAARGHDVPITLASDAHVPQNVGRDLDKAIEHARAAGYETVTVFDQREARQEPLG